MNGSTLYRQKEYQLKSKNHSLMMSGFFAFRSCYMRNNFLILRGKTGFWLLYVSQNNINIG